MAIHFKFRSAVEYDSIDIDGPSISIGSLREMIVEHKNLGRAMDFDLLITNAQTAEEYSEDSFLLPKNTSVIIKRVPASRLKPVVRFQEQPKSDGLAADLVAGDNGRGADTTLQASAVSNAGMDSLDDFGVDLYAIPEPVVSKVDPDENTRIAAMVNTTATEWQRQTQEGLGGGRGSGRGGYGRGGTARSTTGRAFGRATPPQGYVCHRCGQPGHFIQHCPTNGDPTFDVRKMKPPVGIPKTRLKADQEGSYILPDGSVAVMQPDESVFAKEADALLAIRPTYIDPPPELKCPSCGNIFRDAVMIPCCQYSFCDKCIRDQLISKGKCPQCESTKFKNDDLLPNINLRQAIDRFLETQMTTSGASDGFYKQHQFLDVDSGPWKVDALAGSRLQIELRKPSNSAGAPVKGPSTMEAVVVEDVGDSSKNKKYKNEKIEGSTLLTPGGENSRDAIEGLSCKGEHAAETSEIQEAGTSFKGEEMKGSGSDRGEAGMVSKIIEPLSVKETDGVAVESEVSKGKKKKKRARPIQGGDGAADIVGGGKTRKGTQGDRVCYSCGSPDHFAKDCIDHGGPGPGSYGGPHPGMFGLGIVPPMGIPPYGGGFNMEWHGPPMPPHGGPFGYVEGMHGPGPGLMPFNGRMVPGPGYIAPPFVIHSMYPGVPHSSHFRGSGMTGMMDRPPLTREEFIEIQERQRQGRHLQHRMMEHPEREWSREGPNPRERDKERGGNVRPSPDLENRRLKEAIERRPDHDDHVREDEVEHGSRGQHSDGTEYRKSKSDRIERKRVDRGAVNNRHPRRLHPSLDDDVTSLDESKPLRPERPGDRDENVPEKDLRRERESSSRQHREYVEYSSELDGSVFPVKHNKEISRSPRSRKLESRINFSGERLYRSSTREMSQDVGHYNSPEPQDLRLKLGRKHEMERQERRHHVYNDVEIEEHAKEEAFGKSRIKHQYSYSKSKGEEPAENDFEDSRRKQKRKHRKLLDNCVEGRSRGPPHTDLDEPINLRKLKSKGASNPSSKTSELTRFKPVDSSGDLDKNHHSHSYQTKRKNQRPYRS